MENRDPPGSHLTMTSLSVSRAAGTVRDSVVVDVAYQGDIVVQIPEVAARQELSMPASGRGGLTMTSPELAGGDCHAGGSLRSAPVPPGGKAAT